jgi:hypothetical protein
MALVQAVFCLPAMKKPLYWVWPICVIILVFEYKTDLRFLARLKPVVVADEALLMKALFANIIKYNN